MSVISTSVGFTTPNISPTHAGTSFFNSPLFQSQGLSRSNAFRVPAATTVNTYSIHERPGLTDFLSSVIPVEPELTVTVPRVVEPRLPLHQATESQAAEVTPRRQWVIMNPDPEPEDDVLEEDTSVGTLAYHEVPECLRIGSQRPQPTMLVDQLNTPYPEDAVLPDPTQYGGRYEHEQSTTPSRESSVSSRMTTAELRSQIHQELEQEGVREGSHETFGVRELQQYVQQETARSNQEFLSPRSYTPTRQRTMRAHSIDGNPFQGLGVNRMSSFARDFYRNTEVQQRRQSPEPAPQAAQIPSPQRSLRRNHTRTRSTGDINRQFSTGSPRVVLSHKNEAAGLLPKLRRNPQRELSVHYVNEAGIDQGGPSNQAFDRAYKQLLNQKGGVFKKKDDGSYELNLNMNPGDAKDFGLILGRISKLNCGVGHDLDEDFYRKLFNADEYLSHATLSIDESLERQNKNNFIQILTSLDPTLYKADELQDLPIDELADYVKDNAKPFFEIAAGFRATQPRHAEDFETLRTHIGGPLDLKSEFNKSRYETSFRLNTRKRDYFKNLFGFGSNLAQGVTPEQQVQNWFKRAFNEATDEELKNASRNFTGAASFNGDFHRIIFKMDGHMASTDAIYNAHTCFNVVDVNSRMLMTMIKNNQFDLFKAEIFGANDRNNYNNA